MRIGIMGGTFDPIHHGHLVIAEEARVQLALDQVVFVPTGQPWLRETQPMTLAKHRLKMVSLAVESNPFFRAVGIEIDRPGPTYTVDTLTELREQLGGDTELNFILGQDALKHFHLWQAPERVLALCKLVIVSRPGDQAVSVDDFFTQYPKAVDRLVTLETPRVGVSGTDIRRRAAAGISLRYQVPDAVAQYILENHIYQADSGEVLIEDRVDMSKQSESVLVNSIGIQLLELATKSGALKYGQFTLSSGKNSSYYFDGRLLTLDPEGAYLICKAMLPILRQAGVEAVGGPTLGADPMVSAIALASYIEGERIPGFIVRKNTKFHGTMQCIEGPLSAGSKVAIIDDVCTTGESLVNAISAVEAAGSFVVKVVVLLDRREGGAEELRRHGYDFIALMAATPDGRIEVISEL